MAKRSKPVTENALSLFESPALSPSHLEDVRIFDDDPFSEPAPISIGTKKTAIIWSRLNAYYPLFTLEKCESVRRFTIIQKDKKERIDVVLTPGAGMSLPTVSDSDLLKFCASAVKAEIEKGMAITSDGVFVKPDWDSMRTVRFKVTDYFRATNRTRCASAYRDLKETCERLMSTMLTVSVTTASDADDGVSILNVYKAAKFIDDFEIITEESRRRDGTVVIQNMSVKLTLSRQFVRGMTDAQGLMKHDRNYYSLTAFQKNIYEKAKRVLGAHEIIRIKLVNFAVRAGAITSNLCVDQLDSVERTQMQRDIRNFRGQLRKSVILEDTLPDICLAVEPSKPNGEEIIAIFPRNWKSRLTEGFDPVYKRKLTRLEAELLGPKKFYSEIEWFRGLITTATLRQEKNGDPAWERRMMKEREILRRGDAGEKLSAKDKDRYELLKRIREQNGDA